MLDPNQPSPYTPTTKSTPSTITITPSLAIGGCSVTSSVVQTVWDDHKTSVDTSTAPDDRGDHTKSDGGDVNMRALDEQPSPSEAGDLTNQARPSPDRVPPSAAVPVLPPADDDHKIAASTAIEARIIEYPPVPKGIATSSPSAPEPVGIKAPSPTQEQTPKPLRQGYDVTTGTFYYFHEATPPPKPTPVENENAYGEDGQDDVTMENEEEGGEEEKSGESTGEPERSPSLLSSALPGLMRTRRQPRISYAEPYSMRDSESRSPSPTAPTRPKRTYNRRGSRQRSGPDGCPPPPTLRGGRTSESFYIPPLPTNIQAVEGTKQMTMEQKTKLAMELGGRPLRKKELIYIMECMDPDLKASTDRGWVVRIFAYTSSCKHAYFSLPQNTLSQGNSVRKSSKSTKGKPELKTQVVSLESDYVTGYFWWLPGQITKYSYAQKCQPRFTAI
jgi:hypothetical protein